jgi:hypothetical protein
MNEIKCRLTQNHDALFQQRLKCAYDRIAPEMTGVESTPRIERRLLHHGLYLEKNAMDQSLGSWLVARLNAPIDQAPSIAIDHASVCIEPKDGENIDAQISPRNLLTLLTIAERCGILMYVFSARYKPIVLGPSTAAATVALYHDISSFSYESRFYEIKSTQHHDEIDPITKVCFISLLIVAIETDAPIS